MAQMAIKAVMTMAQAMLPSDLLVTFLLRALIIQYVSTQTYSSILYLWCSQALTFIVIIFQNHSIYLNFLRDATFFKDTNLEQLNFVYRYRYLGCYQLTI